MGSACPESEPEPSAGARDTRTRDAEFRALAEALPHIVWLNRRDGALDYFNRRGSDYFGLSPGELADLFQTGSAVHPDDRARTQEAWATSLRAGEPMSVEARLLRHDGAFRWHLMRSQPVADASGRIAAWVGTAIDVHDVREANDRSAFLLALTTELAAISNPQELVCVAMARLRERLHASRVMLAEIDEQANEAVVLRQSGADESRIEILTLPMRPFEWLAAASRGGFTVVVQDSRTDTRCGALYLEWCEREGVRAMISAPLLHGGSLVALLSVLETAPRNWSDSDVELVKRVADIVWPALEKARADRALALSEERLRLAQAVASIGTWEWQPATRLNFLSQETFDLFGLSPGEPHLYDAWIARIEPHDLPAVRQMFNECLEKGSAEVEYCYKHPARGPLWIYSKAGMVGYAGQNCVVGISLDVTKRRQAEEALKDVNRRKDEFLAMLAHELRNPLAPIRNAAQILRVHAGGKPELDWARSVIERQTRHLSRLVDDLLDVSRMVRGQITLQKSVVDLAEIVRHAIETSRPLMRSRHHRLDVRLPSQPVRLDGDLTRLAQVVSNLLNNAAKYTQEGGHVWLDARIENQHVVLSVRDNGFGISPELLPRVFDLFTQGDRTLDRAQGGLGIGLTLVKRLVEMHGGSVEAHSEGLGKGSEFIVRLPIIEGQATQESPDSQGEQVREETVLNEQSSRGLRILVVDDNIDAADSIAMLLSMEGHSTTTVNSAAAALEAVESFRPDVVLLDIGLPEMDGYEVARRLRSQNKVERMRLVAVTGYGQPADRERAAAAGFDKHLVKPVEPAVLNEFLRTLQQRDW
ncbi:MAG TPA: ATP-binding protein [Steroidobacteraceae bacterium]